MVNEKIIDDDHTMRKNKRQQDSDQFVVLFILRRHYVNCRATTAKLAKTSMRHEQWIIVVVGIYALEGGSYGDLDRDIVVLNLLEKSQMHKENIWRL